MIASNTNSEKPLQSQTQRTEKTFESDQKALLLNRRATTDFQISRVLLLYSFYFISARPTWDVTVKDAAQATLRKILTNRTHVHKSKRSSLKDRSTLGGFVPLLFDSVKDVPTSTAMAKEEKKKITSIAGYEIYTL